MALLLILICLGPMKKIGIISAMDEELVLIEQTMKVEHVDTIAQRVFTSGKIKGRSCLCVKAGFGKVNAALTAEILILQYKVDAIIFSGVAGGINPQLGVGDVVISKKVAHHDFGSITTDQFIVFDTIGFAADSFLVQLALKAATEAKLDPLPIKISKEAGHLPQIVVGTIATGDQFISSEEKRQWIEKTFNADCVEMEGAAVAQVCAINKVPFVIVRCLSDLANENANLDFEAFLPYAAKNSSLIVQEMINLLQK